MKQNRTTFIK